MGVGGRWLELQFRDQVRGPLDVSLKTDGSRGPVLRDVLKDESRAGTSGHPKASLYSMLMK